jgi:hypothetical protein
MAKKIVKRKTKKPATMQQSQKQNIIINVTKPATKSRTTSKQPVKQLLPMIPSFNVNQPVQPNDLSKILGLLDRRLQTETKLFTPAYNTIPNVPNEPTQTQLNPIEETTNFKNIKTELPLGEAVNNSTIVKGVPLIDNPITSQLKIPKPRVSELKIPKVEETQVEKITNYFKPIESKSLSESLENIKTSNNEPVITTGKTITVKKVGGKLQLPEVTTEPLGYASAIEPKEQSLPFERKLSELEKLNIRYEKAFGKKYSGPNLKLKDYKKLIQEREAFNKK